MPERALNIVGLNRVIRRFDKATSGGVIDRQLMGEIGTFVTYAILDRTAKGEDVHGQPFDPYSARYKLFKAKAGHPAEIVNLYFTGSMLSSLTHEASQKQVRIFFQNTTDKSGSSNPAKAFFLNEKREFFGVSEEEEEEIRDIVQAHILKVMTGEE